MQMLLSLVAVSWVVQHFITFLKKGFINAVLIERNKLTSGTTWHSAAQVRALRSTQNLTNLIKYSISLYQSLEEETGQQVGWINKGSLSIATNHDRLTHIRRQEALARLYGVEAVSISAEEAKERWPLMNGDDVLGAVWSPDDGRVSPSDLCAALIKGARKQGGRIFEDTGVIGIITEGNKIKGVETTRGIIHTDKIALCTGLWSQKAAKMAGVDIPVWPCEHFYLLTRPIDGISGNMPTLSDHDGHLYIRDDSGGLLVGCFEPLGKPIDPDRLGKILPFSYCPKTGIILNPCFNMLCIACLFWLKQKSECCSMALKVLPLMVAFCLGSQPKQKAFILAAG